MAGREQSADGSKPVPAAAGAAERLGPGHRFGGREWAVEWRRSVKSVFRKIQNSKEMFKLYAGSKITYTFSSES